MTIPRVLLALALMVLGMMIWGVHKDIYGIKLALGQQGATVTQRIDAVNDNINQTVERLMAAISRPPQVITKTEIIRGKTKVRIKYLKPKVHKARKKYMRITHAPPPPVQLDGLYFSIPEISGTYNTPLLP